MINYNEVYTQKTNEAFANIEKTGMYHGRLMAVKISKEPEQFVKEGKEPKNLISFLWDCKNKAGEHVHVSTNTMGISFTDKSNLTKFWNGIKQVKSLNDYLGIVYDKDNKVNDLYASLQIKVEEKEKGTFATVTSVIEGDEVNKGFGTSKISDYDKKVYGKECISIDINPAYCEEITIEPDAQSEFFKRVENA